MLLYYPLSIVNYYTYYGHRRPWAYWLMLLSVYLVLLEYDVVIEFPFSSKEAEEGSIDIKENAVKITHDSY